MYQGIGCTAIFVDPDRWQKIFACIRKYEDQTDSIPLYILKLADLGVLGVWNEQY